MTINLVFAAFDLILCLELIGKIIDYSTIEYDSSEKLPVYIIKETYVKQHQATESTVENVPLDQPSKIKKMSVNMKIEHTEIAVVEELGNADSMAVILNIDTKLRIRTQNNRQIVSGGISHLSIFAMKCYPSRTCSTKHYVLHPCQLTFDATSLETPGTNIRLTSSDIQLNISPIPIGILVKAKETFSSISDVTSGADRFIVEAEQAIDHSDIWTVQPLADHDYWFLKQPPVADIPDLSQAEPVAVPTESEDVNELFTVVVPSIRIVVETGFGNSTRPMVGLFATINAVIRDWSSELTINSSMSLGCTYYNRMLAVWEPIVEPNQFRQLDGISLYVPWAIDFEMRLDQSEDDDPVPSKKMKMLLRSTACMEITVTKTFLEVLLDLIKIFPAPPSDLESSAPYVVSNDTGSEVSLLLGPSDSLRLQDSSASSLGTGVVVHVLAPGARALLQERETHSLDTIKARTLAKYLRVRIDKIKSEIKLPIHLCDRRYFPLNDSAKREPYGVISQVSHELGGSLLTLRSIVQIQNHFTIDVIFWLQTKGEWVEVGIVKAGQTFNVPLKALYAERPDMHVSLVGFKRSATGVNWSLHQNQTEFTTQLMCNPELTRDPFILLLIRKKYDIYHENNSSQRPMLSTGYVIHLMPALYVRNALPVSLYVSVVGSTVAGAEKTSTSGGRLQNIRADDVDKKPMRRKSIVGPAVKPSPTQKIGFLVDGEEELKPGDILHLPTVEMREKGRDHSYIIARILQYLDRNWSCTTEIPSNPDKLAVWVFSSYDSACKLEYSLGVNFETEAGNIRVTVFCPYWFVNKTGQMLSYGDPEDKVKVLYHPPDLVDPIMFSYEADRFFDPKQAVARIESGTWSDKIDLLAGSVSKVECPYDGDTYTLGVTSTMSGNSLTRQIVFTPYFFVINNAPFALEMQEDGATGDRWLYCEPSCCIPFWPHGPSAQYPKIRVKRAEDTFASSSQLFSYAQSQTMLLRLASRCGGINVDVRVTEVRTHIVFTAYHDGDAPALIINHTSEEMVFYERGNATERPMKPRSQMMFTWLDPMGARKIYWKEGKKKTVESDLRRDAFNEIKRSKQVKSYWVSFLDNTQRILLFTDNRRIAIIANKSNRDLTTQEIRVEIHGIGVSLVGNLVGKRSEVMYMALSSSKVMWQKQKRKTFYKAFSDAIGAELETYYQQFMWQRRNEGQFMNTFQLSDGSTMELHEDKAIRCKKDKAQTIRRVFHPGLKLVYRASPYQKHLVARIYRVQIDNQMLDCAFPVLLAPVPQLVIEQKPFVEYKLVQRIIQNSSVEQYKEFSVLVQEFHVKIDMMFVTELLALLSPLGTDNTNTSAIEEKELALFYADLAEPHKPVVELVLLHSSQEQKKFYDKLHFGDLKIHVSFSIAGMQNQALPVAVATVLQGVGVTLININDIVLHMAAFERQYRYFTRAQLVSEVSTHYVGQGLRQAHVLIFGLDVIGNPYGLVVGLRTGLTDLFYEPWRGAFFGPAAFLQGVQLGSRSLLKNTVGAAFGTVSKITGAMGKGLAVLSCDRKFQIKRRRQLNRKPTSLTQGLARSGRRLVLGFYHGVTGLVTQPIDGASSPDRAGAMKGMGRGVIGLVIRPVIGLVDCVSLSTGSIRRATELTEEPARQRPRRALPANGVVMPFNAGEAIGNELIWEMDKGRYRNTDTFVEFETLAKRAKLLLTDKHILLCTVRNVFGRWRSKWTYQWSECTGVVEVEKGIELQLAAKKGACSSGKPRKKLIAMPANARRKQLADTIQFWLKHRS